MPRAPDRGATPEPERRPEPQEKDPRIRASLDDEPDIAEEHTPSATDPPNARPDDDLPDERWDDPTGV